jgi:hypothetical protein
MIPREASRHIRKRAVLNLGLNAPSHKCKQGLPSDMYRSVDAVSTVVSVASVLINQLKILIYITYLLFLFMFTYAVSIVR